MKNKPILAKVFILAFVLNTIENLLLLGYFSVPIAQNSVIGAAAFAFVFTLTYNKLEDR